MQFISNKWREKRRQKGTRWTRKWSRPRQDRPKAYGLCDSRVIAHDRILRAPAAGSPRWCWKGPEKLSKELNCQTRRFILGRPVLSTFASGKLLASEIQKLQTHTFILLQMFTGKLDALFWHNCRKNWVDETKSPSTTTIFANLRN